MARQLAQGYLGLQTHGGTDRISYREIQVKEIAPADIPVNTAAPTVSGSGYRAAAEVQPRHVDPAAGHASTSSRWYRSNKIAAEQPAPPCAEPARLREQHDARRPERSTATRR